MFEKIFVYGTLRRGECNHSWLRNGRCLGEWTSPPGFTLYDLGDYPGAVAGGCSPLRGEVYEIAPEMLHGLDMLEECPTHYRRVRIATAFGQAWIYLLNQPPDSTSLIPEGDWVRYRHERKI